MVTHKPVTCHLLQVSIRACTHLNNWKHLPTGDIHPLGTSLDSSTAAEQSNFHSSITALLNPSSFNYSPSIHIQCHMQAQHQLEQGGGSGSHCHLGRCGEPAGTLFKPPKPGDLCMEIVVCRHDCDWAPCFSKCKVLRQRCSPHR